MVNVKLSDAVSAVDVQAVWTSAYAWPSGNRWINTSPIHDDLPSLLALARTHTAIPRPTIRQKSSRENRTEEMELAMDAFERNEASDLRYKLANATRRTTDCMVA